MYVHRGFGEAGNLKQHISTVHQGKRTHTCEICDKSFSSNSDLKRNVETVLVGTKPHVCTVCDKRFANSSHLKQHINKFHTADVCTENKTW